MTARPLWTAAEAAKASGAEAAGDWQANGVSIDSRTTVPGDLFVALKGPRFDGHDFVAEALAKGASAALVERVPGGVPENAPLLRVESSLGALNGLATAARARTKGRILAVTGSVGKTGTKEMLRRMLEDQAPTTGSAESFNNHIGVPLSLVRMPEESAFGVFEVGMNHPGEITPLARLLRPHAAVVTAVEAAHLDAFPSLEAIADAKAEIFDGMDKGGIAILNRDNPQFARLAEAARARGIERIVGFGKSPEAQARLLELVLRPDGSEVRAEIGGRELAYTLGLPGAHWAMNSVAALAAVDGLEADPARAARRLHEMKPLTGRGERHPIALADGAFVLIDESYNASPASMRAALELLEGTPLGRGGRRVAVLGEMLELGTQAAAFHAALAEPAAGVDLVFTAGNHMRQLYDALPPERRGGHGAASTDLIPLVREAVRSGDVVMVKGSAASRMGLIVEALRALPAETDSIAAARA